MGRGFGRCRRHHYMPILSEGNLCRFGAMPALQQLYFARGQPVQSISNLDYCHDHRPANSISLSLCKYAACDIHTLEAAMLTGNKRWDCRVSVLTSLIIDGFNIE